MKSKDAYLALNLLPRIGPIRVRRMLDAFESPERILEASVPALRSIPGIGPEMARQIHQWEDHIDLEEEKRRMQAHGIRAITLADDEYPAALREIHDPPFLLYIKGRLQPSDAAAVSIVGSRRMTHYGREQAHKLGYQLAHAGFTIISGLARGIDTSAHEAALAANGRTIAVLGSGIGNVYPPENQSLADRIAESGAVISEFPVLYVPDKQSFPLRNRIVSGMAQGLLVVEAPARSGSMITANQALEQGRAIFAVPGPIDRPSSEGCHRLIQSGATLVTSGKDIIENLASGLNQLPLEFDTEAKTHPGDCRPQPELDEVEERILVSLEQGQASIDTLSDRLSLPAGVISASLLKLEMKSAVKQLPGKYFTKLI